MIRVKIIILTGLVVIVLTSAVLFVSLYKSSEKPNLINPDSDKIISKNNTISRSTQPESEQGTSSSINVTEDIDTPEKFFRTKQIPYSISSADTVISSTSSKLEEGPYSYLFKGNREANTSNIVGYFAHGAFAWSVPDWLVSNWEMKPFRAEGMIFTAKVRAIPTPGQQYDFSDIIFDVSTSTELINSHSLYLTMLRDIPKDEIIISEILLNKSTEDLISIQMENSTRIYHITAYTRDFKRISDLYFMDGNGKTLDLRFETRADIFPQFSDKIRDMVEGVGELKLPQG